MTFASLGRWFNHRTAPVDKPEPVSDLSEAESQFQAGLRFACGKGAAQDYAQAARCYTQAAELNHSLAQFNLAMMYSQGQGMDCDEEKAAMWMLRAAEQGDAGAQYKLGVEGHLTCRGFPVAGTSEARIEALKWVRLSAAQGYRGAGTACEYVSLKMTWEEVAEGGRRAAAFGEARKNNAGTSL